MVEMTETANDILHNATENSLKVLMDEIGRGTSTQLMTGCR